MPIRIHLRRTKGWRLPDGAVVVSRPSRFGNPWTIGGAREAGYRGIDAELGAMCAATYREWLERRAGSLTEMLANGERLRSRILEGLSELRGRDLACWCPEGQACHADVLLDLANREREAP